MAEEELAHNRELVQHFRAEAGGYFRQWTLSLGIGSGGAAVALISLAANLPDPDFAFRLFAPSLWTFLVGIISSAASLPFAASMSGSKGEHFAEASNRDQFRTAASKIPEVIASPLRLADEMNSSRDQLTRRGDQHHKRAEAAWTLQERWKLARTIALTISALAFVLGVSLPLTHVSLGGRLAPPKMRTVSKAVLPTEPAAAIKEVAPND